MFFRTKIIKGTPLVQLGPQLVALQAWEALGFTPVLEGLGMNAGAIATAQLMVANRLVKPLSEWALIDIAFALKGIVGTVSPVLGVLTSFQEQIEWHLRIASLQARSCSKRVCS